MNLSGWACVLVNPIRASGKFCFVSSWPVKKYSLGYHKLKLEYLNWVESCMKQNSFSSLLRTKENGFDREPLHSEHPSKRPCTISPGQRYSPNNGLSYQPNGLPHPTPPPPQHYRLDDMAIAHHYRDSYRHPSHRDLRDRTRPMGKTGGSVFFSGDWVIEDLCHYFSTVFEPVIR